jgi:hypothetical protein
LVGDKLLRAWARAYPGNHHATPAERLELTSALSHLAIHGFNGTIQQLEIAVMAWVCYVSTTLINQYYSPCCVKQSCNRGSNSTLTINLPWRWEGGAELRNEGYFALLTACFMAVDREMTTTAIV